MNERVLGALDIRGARILIVDDVPANLDVLRQALEKAGYKVSVAPSGEVALRNARAITPDLILLDVMMPGMDGYETCRQLKAVPETRGIPVIFITARDELEGLVAGFEAGGVDYVAKPFRQDEVLLRVRTHLEKARLTQALQQKNRDLEVEIARREALTLERNQLAGQISLASQREASRWGLGTLVGQSPTLKKVLDNVDLLQTTHHTSVLILGESGTGKELVARAIHDRGPRRHSPFVPVNCASLPRELADSLLFGHRKGAFTGADQDQAGYFALAHGGTLFLDEVGTLPLELQPKLLRVLEERTVDPLGSREPQAVDVRVVAATNADLAAQAQTGGFRGDLYYRLAGFTVRMPPLRERREDIGLLVRHFLQIFAVEMGIEPPPISPPALALLEGYDFPGNVRELKNLVERVLIESRGGEIRLEHLPPLEAVSPGATGIDALPLNLEQVELMLIQRAMAQSEGNISRAARLLGIDRAKIYRRLEQLSKLPPLNPG